MSSSSPDALHRQLAAVAARERTIVETLDSFELDSFKHPTAVALFRDWRAIASEQAHALELRLEAIAPGERIEQRHQSPGGGTHYPVTAALQTMYSLFCEALVTYATLQPIAHRFRDSWAAADEGTTAHLSRRHTQTYARAINQISRIIHDVVLSEMEHDGLECQCTCPSCGIGVCVCAPSSRRVLSDAWHNAHPIVAAGGVPLHTPRPDSAAARAGLVTGDLIVSIDGRQIQDYEELQDRLRSRDPRKGITLTVQRAAGEIEDVPMPPAALPLAAGGPTERSTR
jgi:hypothetical protein